MNAKQAKLTARAWVKDNIEQWPGLRAAHLVGGITTMADEAPFPADKDVDLHLIFADDSQLLANPDPWSGIIEESYGGIAIEAGLKPVTDYRSAAAVLGNPEIAHHLLVDSVLHDPDGLLHDLQAEVRRDYPRRRWVCARLQYERQGLAGALSLLETARATMGASGEVNILGYTTTFATAALWVATLNPPKMGGRTLLRLRQVLAAYDRVDLHEDLLAILGLSNLSPERIERFLDEAIAGFDLALAVRRTPGPFQHKLHPHLRAYFVGACREMLAEGYHREAMGWVLPYHLATADVILADGPDPVKPGFAARRADLLRALGLDTAEARAAAIERATRLYDQIFALADEIVANNPGVMD